MLYEIGIYDKPMLIAQDEVKFCGVLDDKSFLVNNFADFLNVVRVQIIKILFSRRQHFVTATSTIM